MSMSFSMIILDIRRRLLVPIRRWRMPFALARGAV
jgi:hypothetical protein